MTSGSIRRSAPSLDDTGTTYGGYTWLLCPSIVTLGLGTFVSFSKAQPDSSPTQTLAPADGQCRSSASIDGQSHIYKLMSTIRPHSLSILYFIAHCTNSFEYLHVIVWEDF